MSEEEAEQIHQLYPGEFTCNILGALRYLEKRGHDLEESLEILDYIRNAGYNFFNFNVARFEKEFMGM